MLRLPRNLPDGHPATRPSRTYRGFTVSIRETRGSLNPQEKTGERVPSHRLESNYGTSAIGLEAPLAWLSPCAS